MLFASLGLFCDIYVLLSTGSCFLLTWTITSPLMANYSWIRPSHAYIYPSNQDFSLMLATCLMKCLEERVWERE